MSGLPVLISSLQTLLFPKSSGKCCHQHWHLWGTFVSAKSGELIVPSCHLNCTKRSSFQSFKFLSLWSWWRRMKKKTKTKNPNLEESQTEQLILFRIFSLSVSKPILLFTNPSLLPVPTTGSYCPPNAEQTMPINSGQIQTISCNVSTTKVSANSCEIPEN